jgi:hypothetical protein
VIIFYEEPRDPPWTASNPQYNAPNPPWKNNLLSIAKIEDGTSKTLLIGEKFVPSNAYEGGAWGDNYGWYQGHAWDSVRYSNDPPEQDNPSMAPKSARGETPCDCDQFGSAHASGFNASMADGSTQLISYDIEHRVFKALTNRRDGSVIENAF